MSWWVIVKADSLHSSIFILLLRRWWFVEYDLFPEYSLKLHTNVGYKYTGLPRGGGEFSRAPRRLGGGGHARAEKYWKVFQVSSFWPQICIKSIFGGGSAPDRTPLGELTMLPQTPSWMVRGHPPHISSLLDAGVMRLWGPCDNGFPGPAGLSTGLQIHQFSI